MPDPPVGVHLRAFNWRIYERRRELRMTQIQLARISGLETQLISRIETLRQWPTDDQAREIADALDLAVEDVFPEELRDAVASTASASVRFAVPLSSAGRLLGGPSPPLLADPFNDELKAALRAAMADFPPRTRRILEMRFGLTGNGSMTYEEIAVELNVTRERIRQIETKAMRLLRARKRADALRPYLEELPDR